MRRIPTQIVGGTGARGIGAVNFKPRHFFASATWAPVPGRELWPVTSGGGRRLRNGLGRTERAPCSAGLWGAWIAKTKTAEAEARRAATGTARQRREGARAASRRQGEEGRSPNRSGALQPDATARDPRTPRSWAPSRAPARRSGSRFRAATVRGDRNAPCQKRAGSASGQAK